MFHLFSYDTKLDWSSVAVSISFVSRPSSVESSFIFVLKTCNKHDKCDTIVRNGQRETKPKQRHAWTRKPEKKIIELFYYKK